MSQAPFKDNLTIYQGASFDVVRTWKAGTPAVAVDLTGCTARMHIREELGSTTPLVTLTTENGGIELGGTAGTVRRIMTAAATAVLAPEDFGPAVYDLEIIFADGTVRRLLAGTATLSPEITRA